MPRSPARPCTWPGGCPALVPGGGRCPDHQPPPRPSPSARGYDAKWRKVSKSYLAAHPYCAEPGCFQASAHVDHVDGKGPLGPRGLDPTGFRALCKPHHSAKTARQTPGGWNQRD